MTNVGLIAAVLAFASCTAETAEPIQPAAQPGEEVQLMAVPGVKPATSPNLLQKEMIVQQPMLPKNLLPGLPPVSATLPGGNTPEASSNEESGEGSQEAPTGSTAPPTTSAENAPGTPASAPLPGSGGALDESSAQESTSGPGL
jgi:hypothetical protein